MPIPDRLISRFHERGRRSLVSFVAGGSDLEKRVRRRWRSSPLRRGVETFGATAEPLVVRTAWGSARLGMSASVTGWGCGFAAGVWNTVSRGRFCTGFAKKPSIFVARFGLKLSYFLDCITLGYCTRKTLLNKGVITSTIRKTSRFCIAETAGFVVLILEFS